MPNYLIINKSSNLIVRLVSSNSHPKESSTHLAIRVSDTMLTKYLKLLRRTSRNGTLVDAGELAKISPAFLDALIFWRTTKRKH